MNRSTLPPGTGVSSHTDLPGTLDPDLAEMLRADAGQNGPDFHEVPLDEARKNHARTLEDLTARLPDADIRSAEDTAIESNGREIPLHIVTPKTADTGIPLLLYIHGGGWIFSSMKWNNRLAAVICEKTGAIVVSVDYALAPEHPFPQALEDCYASALWTYENAEHLGGDPGRISVGGESAGGNLSAAVSYLVRDNAPFDFVSQTLIYPALDLSSMETRSHRDFAEGYLISREAMVWFVDQYVADNGQRKNPLASPLFAENSANLPPALIATAEFDGLRDEAYKYSEKLQAAGSAAQYICFTGMTHAFPFFSGFSKGARRAFNDLLVRMKKLL